MNNKNAILFLLLVIIFGFGFLPQYKKSQTLQTKTITLEVQRNSNIETLKNLETENQANEIEKDALLQKIPTEQAQESLMQDIFRITQNSGFSFQQIRFTESVNTEQKEQQIIASFSVQGPQGNLVKLLQAIEQNPRFLTLGDISVQNDKTNQQTTSLLQLDISAYSLLP